jgi:hypothetical protein
MVPGNLTDGSGTWLAVIDNVLYFAGEYTHYTGRYQSMDVGATRWRACGRKCPLKSRFWRGVEIEHTSVDIDAEAERASIHWNSRCRFNGSRSDVVLYRSIYLLVAEPTQPGCVRLTGRVATIQRSLFKHFFLPRFQYDKRLSQIKGPWTHPDLRCLHTTIHYPNTLSDSVSAGNYTTVPLSTTQPDQVDAPLPGFD